MSKSAFDKFINKELKGAKKKEAYRQEKRQTKLELKKRGDELRRINEERYKLVKPAEHKSEKKIEVPAKKAYFISPKENSPIKKHLKTKDKNAPKYRKGVPVKQTWEQITQKPVSNQEPVEGLMPLNKYIAHSDICGKREATELVKEGKVQVNGSIVFEPGFKVSTPDKVLVKGKLVHLQKNLVYFLLNKPKDYITTAKDPEGRKTVFDLLKGATKERIYPVGRLDRNTTGVLILTNDGELAQKLTHPSFEVKKIYEVKLDKPVTKKDLETIVSGITLDDGFVKADSVSYADAHDKSVVGIEIHSGRNRIVRRIFEHLGYDVRNLDRVMFANLTKKNVDRGKWRPLNEKEIRLLKFMNQSFVRNKQ